MISMLTVCKIDLNWAENQYWSTLLKCIGEVNRLHTPSKKEKLTAKEAKNYIR